MEETKLNDTVNVRKTAPERKAPNGKKTHRIRYTWADYVIAAVLILFSVMTFYQLWYVVIGSFSNGQEYASGRVFLLPKGFTWANYSVIFHDDVFWTAFRNTVLRTVTGVSCSLIFTAMVAYGMTSKYLRCRDRCSFRAALCRCICCCASSACTIRFSYILSPACFRYTI